MKKLLFVLTTICLFYVSCSDGVEEEKPVVAGIDSSAAFRKFLKKFRLISLPYEFDGNPASDFNYDQVEDTDSVFCKDVGNFCYALLPDTTRYFAVITLAPSDDLFPVLITYDKKGNQISYQSLLMGNCGAYMCGSYCKPDYRINSDLSIMCVDTEKVMQCDSLMNPVNGSEENRIIQLKGKIIQTGKIELARKEGTF